MTDDKKPTWVFVAGTYRTASTTQYRIVRDIVERTDSGIGIGYHTEEKLRHFDEQEHRYIVCKVFEFLPESFKGRTSYGKTIHRQLRARAVVSVRDPRDIIVSMRRRWQDIGREFDFDDVVMKDLPKWLGNSMRWANLGPRLSYFSRFEMFTTNLLNETRNIARFLEVNLDGKVAKDIAAGLSIRAQYETAKIQKKGEQIDEWLPEIPRIVFGTSGQWRTWLNEPERKLVEKHTAKYMERFGYA